MGGIRFWGAIVGVPECVERCSLGDADGELEGYNAFNSIWNCRNSNVYGMGANRCGVGDEGWLCSCW